MFLVYLLSLLIGWSVTGNAGVTRDGDELTLWVENRNRLYWLVLALVSFVAAIEGALAGLLK